MNTTTNYQFVPAYYEWHFIDANNPEKVLLNWVDPIDDLYDDYNKETGEYEDEAHLMTDFDEVWLACEAFIETGDRLFKDEGIKDFEGISFENWAQLPKDAAIIMAKALYNYYIKEDEVC